jgi:hypothetical protein
VGVGIGVEVAVLVGVGCGVNVGSGVAVRLGMSVGLGVDVGRVVVGWGTLVAVAGTPSACIGVDMATDDGGEEHALSVGAAMHNRHTARSEKRDLIRFVLPPHMPVIYRAIFKLAILYIF